MAAPSEADLVAQWNFAVSQGHFYDAGADGEMPREFLSKAVASPVQRQARDRMNSMCIKNLF